METEQEYQISPLQTIFELTIKDGGGFPEDPADIVSYCRTGVGITLTLENGVQVTVHGDDAELRNVEAFLTLAGVPVTD